MIFSKKKKFLYEHNLYNLSIPQKLQKFPKHNKFSKFYSMIREFRKNKSLYSIKIKNFFKTFKFKIILILISNNLIFQP